MRRFEGGIVAFISAGWGPRRSECDEAGIYSGWHRSCRRWAEWHDVWWTQLEKRRCVYLKLRINPCSCFSRLPSHRSIGRAHTVMEANHTHTHAVANPGTDPHACKCSDLQPDRGGTLHASIYFQRLSTGRNWKMLRRKWGCDVRSSFLGDRSQTCLGWTAKQIQSHATSSSGVQPEHNVPHKKSWRAQRFFSIWKSFQEGWSLTPAGVTQVPQAGTGDMWTSVWMTVRAEEQQVIVFSQGV